MILSSKIVRQTIDRNEGARYLKELIMTSGPVPLAMVRKRAVSRRGAPIPSRATLVLIHGYGQNRYAWHLPKRSLACYLASAGYDVFNLELRGHGRSGHLGAKTPFSPDDYVLADVPSAIESVQRVVGSDRPVFLVGHSLGGLVSYAVTPRLPGKIAGIASIGSPYHFLRGAKGLARLGKLLLFLDARLRLVERAPAMELHLVGEAVRSFRAFVESPLYPLPFRGYYPKNIEPKIISQHMALAMDMGSIRVMREMFFWAVSRERETDAPGGLEGFGAAFEAMTDVPLLVIAGSEDDLAPPDGVRSAYERSHAVDKTYRELPAGHIDLLVGENSPDTTWPILDAWLTRRAEGLVAA